MSQKKVGFPSKRQTSVQLVTVFGLNLLFIFSPYLSGSSRECQQGIV